MKQQFLSVLFRLREESTYYSVNAVLVLFLTLPNASVTTEQILNTKNQKMTTNWSPGRLTWAIYLELELPITLL